MKLIAVVAEDFPAETVSTVAAIVRPTLPRIERVSPQALRQGQVNLTGQSVVAFFGFQALAQGRPAAVPAGARLVIWLQEGELTEQISSQQVGVDTLFVLQSRPDCPGLLQSEGVVRTVDPVLLTPRLPIFDAEGRERARGSLFGAFPPLGRIILLSAAQYHADQIFFALETFYLLRTRSRSRWAMIVAIPGCDNDTLVAYIDKMNLSRDLRIADTDRVAEMATLTALADLVVFADGPHTAGATSVGLAKCYGIPYTVLPGASEQVHLQVLREWTQCDDRTRSGTMTRELNEVDAARRIIAMEHAPKTTEQPVQRASEPRSSPLLEPIDTALAAQRYADAKHDLVHLREAAAADDSEVALRLGKIYLLESAYEQALQEFRRVAETRTELRFAADLGLARIYLKLRMPRDALHALHRCLDYLPRHSGAVLALCQWANQQDCAKSGIQELESYLAQCGDHAHVLRALANLYRRLGADDRSLAMLERAQQASDI